VPGPRARARRFSECLLKHNLSSKVIPKKTGLGLYEIDSEFILHSNSIPLIYLLYLRDDFERLSRKLLFFKSIFDYLLF